MKRVRSGLALIALSFMIPAIAQEKWFVVNQTQDRLKATIETATGEPQEVMVAPVNTPGDTQSLPVLDHNGRGSIMSFKVEGPSGKGTVIYKTNKPAQRANTEYFQYAKLGKIMKFKIQKPIGRKKNYKIKGSTEADPDYEAKLTK